MKIKSVPFISMAVILVIGMVASSFAVSRLFIKLEKESELMVKGYAERNIRSDQGRFLVNLNVYSKTLAEAYKKLNADTAILQAKIKEVGFKEEEVGVANVQMQKIVKKDANGKDTNETDFYQLTLPVTVTSANVDLINDKHKALNALLQDGIEIQVFNPEYYINGVDKYKMELLSMATRNGYERAGLIANSSGGKIKKLISAKQGVFQITAPNSSDVSDCGIYDLSSLNKNAKIVVTLKYRLE